MALGKYECDYCSKQFQDTPFARKRHLQSLQHRRAKALWFDSFNDFNLAPTQSSSSSGAVCNRFLKTGFCRYGDSCKYFHPKNNINTTSGDKIEILFGNLPPSLQPPPEGGYQIHPPVNWG